MWCWKYIVIVEYVDFLKLLCVVGVKIWAWRKAYLRHASLQFEVRKADLCVLLKKSVLGEFNRTVSRII